MEKLGGANFWRLRLGVGRPASKDPRVVSDFVLSRFTSQENAALHDAFDKARGVVEAWAVASPEERVAAFANAGKPKPKPPGGNSGASANANAKQAKPARPGSTSAKPR